MGKKDDVVLQSHAVLLREIQKLTAKVEALEKRIPTPRLLESGNYVATITSIAKKTSRAGKRPFYHIEYTTDVGTKLWEVRPMAGFTPIEQLAQLVNTSVRSIDYCCDPQWIPDEELDKLIGRRVVLTVTKKPHYIPERGEVNEVRKVERLLWQEQ